MDQHGKSGGVVRGSDSRQTFGRIKVELHEKKGEIVISQEALEGLRTPRQSPPEPS